MPKLNNRIPGSPMIDNNDVKARYLRLTDMGTEKTGLYLLPQNNIMELLNNTNPEKSNAEKSTYKCIFNT